MNTQPSNAAQAFAYSSAGSHHHAAHDYPSTNQNPDQPSYFVGESTRTFDYPEPSPGPPNLNTQYISPVDDNWSQNGAHGATPSSAHPFQEQTSQGPFHTGTLHSHPADWYYTPQEEQQGRTSSFTQPPPPPPPPDGWPMQPSVSHPGSNVGLVSFAPVHGTQGSNSSWPYQPSTSSAGYARAVTWYPRDHTGVVPGIQPYSQGHAESSSAAPSFNRVQNTSYPQPITPQRTDPFFSFPIGDGARVISYHQNSSHTDQTNNKLLGVEPTPEYEEPASLHSYSAPVLPPANPHSEPAVSAQQNTTLTEVLSKKDREKLKYFEGCLPGDKKLQREALLLSKEGWLISNEPEPPLETGADQNLPITPSRFDAYFSQGGNHRCHWTVDGKRCSHIAPRRERALGHARFHFDYKPFHCGATCGVAECGHKYHCQSALKDHVRRKGNPSGACGICKAAISVQNMKRHMKTHEPKRSKLSRVTKALSSVKRVIKRTLSRSPSPSPSDMQ